MIKLMAITMKMNIVIKMVIIEGGVWLGQYCLGSDPERGGRGEGGFNNEKSDTRTNGGRGWTSQSQLSFCIWQQGVNNRKKTNFNRHFTMRL